MNISSTNVVWYRLSVEVVREVSAIVVVRCGAWVM